MILVLMPVALIYIGLGLICGTIFSEKAAVGICGALLTNVSAWLSGVMPHLWWVLIYAVVILLCSIYVFTAKTKEK